MFNKLATEERLRKLERAIQRLENAQCCPTGCARINWSYSGRDLGDDPFFTITVNGTPVVNAPSDEALHTGTFYANDGDIVELTMGNGAGFHIWGFIITDSDNVELATGGNFTGSGSGSFEAACGETYTIIGNQ